MNEEKMKSAIELALEKTERLGKQARAEQVPLTEEMRKEIEEIEKENQAKIAEKDIMLKAELGKLPLSYPPPEAELMAAALTEKFNEEKKSLEDEKEGKIEEIKKRAKT